MMVLKKRRRTRKIGDGIKNAKDSEGVNDHCQSNVCAPRCQDS